ncbi:monovalent cation/H(+) antiporter subunit G [Knoellia aerolata]|uniref:Cation:proton antiporter n=1 Tax=Knoellia aerolata DSM 18566 TaxID=1385519 RepID=A0A0A0JVM3_9MICO|nr:monovalent cation/H(+) antiporter subunit G [Knoellia aerolata]KGN41450.1 cation:proton antiporter [Knoellia aerolata DSM 18566]
MIDVLAGACLILGSLLALIAGIGLVRFPDVLTRMHAATKPQTLGVLLILLGLALRVEDRSVLAVIALAAVFQLVTAPVSAHMLGRAALRAGHIDRARLSRDDLLEHDAETRSDPAADGPTTTHRDHG